MIKFYLNVDCSNMTETEKYRFYKARLYDFKCILKSRLSFLKLSAVERNLLLIYDNGTLQSMRADLRPISYQILNYIINSLNLFIDTSGEYFYSLDINIYNPFSKTVSIDKLWRILEYGTDKIKPTKLFRSSVTELNFKVDRIVKLMKRGF